MSFHRGLEGALHTGVGWARGDSMASIPWLPWDLAFELPGHGPGLGDREEEAFSKEPLSKNRAILRRWGRLPNLARKTAGETWERSRTQQCP